MILLWLTLAGCIDQELYDERRDELLAEQEEEEQRADTATDLLDTASDTATP